MAPPRARGAAADAAPEEPLCAVVLADSFNTVRAPERAAAVLTAAAASRHTPPPPPTRPAAPPARPAQRFRPASVERPKVLTPLAGAPLLDYTLAWLAGQGVADVFVVCCAHAAAVEAHLKASGWAGGRRFRKVQAVAAGGCLSAGDALRLLDHADLIKGDFVLVYGDVVASLDLRPALAAHRARRAADRAAVLTLLWRGGLSATARRRLGDAGGVAALDPATGRLLKYEDAPARGGRRRAPLRLDATLFGERSSIEVRSDLLDTGIAIAAPEVLMLFADNFDYQDVRRDFLGGVLSEEELGNKVFVHEAAGGYAARVTCLRAYDAVSRDVLARWAHPFAPDTGALAPPARPDRGGASYTAPGAAVDRGAAVGAGCLVCAGAAVGAGASLRDTVVGPGAAVGAGASLRGCHLGAGARVGAGAVLTSCWVLDGAVVGARARVGAGSVLSYGVVVDAGAVVPAGSRLSLARPPRVDASDGGSSSDGGEGDAAAGPEPDAVAAAATLAAGGVPEAPVAFDTAVVGALGAGFAWPRPEDEAADEALWGLAPPPPRAPGAADAGASSDDDGSASDGGGDGGGSGADASAGAAAAAAAAGGPAFKREVAETLLRCALEGISLDNVVIELNGLKIAEDRTFGDCARYMLTTLLGLCLPPPPDAAPEFAPLYDARELDAASPAGRAELLRRAAAQLRRWRPLLAKFLRDEEDQVELLLTLEEFCGEEGDYENAGERGAAFAAAFPQVLKLLYDADAVSEEAVLAWASEKAGAAPEEKVFLERAEPFLRWLREAEEDESSGSGEESEEE
jgi:translation initiation factor eIF-2B subunit epsilon